MLCGPTFQHDRHRCRPHVLRRCSNTVLSLTQHISVCRINLCTTHLTAQPTDFINVIVCFSRHGQQSASAVHLLVRHSITRSASTSEHSTISAVISLYLPASALQNIMISYPAYFLRSLIIQLHIEFFIISEFFINSRLYIFVPYIASDFYNTLLPTFTIMHRSVSFHRTFGDMTQTCAFFNFNVFNVLPTQEGDFCVWRASN